MPLVIEKGWAWMELDSLSVCCFLRLQIFVHFATNTVTYSDSQL